MTLTEADRIARAKAIDALYRQRLGRPIDPNGVSYACSDLTLEEIEAILRWGELPPQLFIGDGWDPLPDGTWPMVGIQHEAQRDAVVADARAKHRNALVVIAAHPAGAPGAEIEPVWSRLMATDAFMRAVSARIMTVDVVQEVSSRLRTTDTFVRAAGFAPFYFLWSREAESRWGTGKAHVRSFADALPAGSDIAVIELDEYWSDAEWNMVSAELAARHRVWNHFTPGRTASRWGWIHGLAYQADETEVDTAIVALSNARQVWRDKAIVFAEAQNLNAAQRWEVAQWGFRRGIGSLHCGRPRV